MDADLNDFFGESAPIMPKVMIDIETMGTQPDAPMIALGAVTFDEDRAVMGQRFYRAITLKSCVDQGAVIDPDTVMWWLKQSDDARNALFRNPQHISVVLTDFAGWLYTYAGPVSAVQPYGNGADFDCTIVKEHYRRAGLEMPWEFWNVRCYRTLKSRSPMIEPPPRNGTHHNALDDAVYQVEHLFAINRALRRKVA